MASQEVVVEGTLRPDGALELDERPNLTPGRVTVILRPAAGGAGGDAFWQRMQAMWDAQSAAGRPTSSAGPDAAEARAEWEDRQTTIERLQDECRAARDSGGGGGR